MPPGLGTGKLSSSADPKEFRQNQSARTIAPTLSSHRFRPICLFVACASLVSLGAFGSVTYHFDWYCSGCATIVWKHAHLPVGDGCAPASISLGTWRRG
ncbi:MAG: hypothetical protein A3H35_10095 [Betaproteobacteria bacterium RIFCSPLOWO2_02_FULL_62_17]|nr:MAG: hypothetical protein A3H35_10095 [Betaproteobacteria bacterium RIFCSPLOWO2_02_FULL_62_17]